MMNNFFNKRKLVIYVGLIIVFLVMRIPSVSALTIADFKQILSNYTTGNIQSDLNGDGKVNAVDAILAILQMMVTDPSPLPIPSVSPHPSGGSVPIEQNGFETNTYSPFKPALCCSYSGQITQDIPAHGGTHVMRFELHRDDPIIELSKRAELYSQKLMYKTDYWYRWSIFIPTDWQYDKSKEIIVQWHSEPDFNLGENWRNPPFSLRIFGNNYEVRTIWDSNPVTKSNIYMGDQYINLGPYAKGVWTEFVLHARWSYTNDTSGYLELFKNGTSIYKKIGPNTFNDAKGPYMKFGIYKFDWKDNPQLSSTTTRVLYFDDVSIEQGN